MKTLKINGMIALSQFWPKGKSDADTTKIDFKVSSFGFNTDGGQTFRPTQAFVETEIKVRGQSKSVIKYEGQARQNISVRLQGIDAPELHYKIYSPSEIKEYNSNPVFKQLNGVEYRQFMAETATVALANHLAPFADANGNIPCYFISYNLNEPKDVLDVYGRFVGDIFVEATNENINHWLLKENWVMPAYYNSMLPAEITTLDTLWGNGISKNRISGQYTNRVGAFDFSLQFRSPETDPQPNAEKDKGAVVFPKLYRRLCPYSIKKKAGIENITFEQSLRDEDRSDRLVFTRDFLAQGGAAPVLTLSKVFTNGKLEYQGHEVKPNEIIFIEKDSPNAKLLKKLTQVEVTTF